MASSKITVVTDSRSNAAFQNLLLRLSEAVSAGGDYRSILRLFCHATRQFFGVSGIYFWELSDSGELIGTEADGLMADQFRGRRLPLDGSNSAVAIDVVRSRKTTYLNHLDSSRFPMAHEFGTRSILGAPLIIFGQVTGVIVFLSASDPDFFDDDLSAKATILASQVGSLLEAVRLTQVSVEERRRATVLAEVAQSLTPIVGAESVAQSLAERLRVLLGSPVACIVSLRQSEIEVRATSAATGASASAFLAAFRQPDRLSWLKLIAEHAVAGNQAQEVAFDSANEGFGETVFSGNLLVLPIRTSRADGAAIVFPREQALFTAAERSLAVAVAVFGAMAIANAELYGTASSQAQELHELLEISAELNSAGRMDDFMRKFALRGARFLGFHRLFLALLEDGKFRVRWSASGEQTQPGDGEIPEGIATRQWRNRECFWADDVSTVPGINREIIEKFRVKQMLAVPLLGSDQTVLGAFGVLDRQDGAGITEEDIRRARALAAQVAVALEMKRNVDDSEQHRRRAEALTNLVLQTSSLLRMPDFANGFVERAAGILGAEAAALALEQDSKLAIAALYGSKAADIALLNRLGVALGEVVAAKPGPVTGSAEELLGSALSVNLGWKDLTAARLQGRGGELIGVLCLANRRASLGREDQQLLQAVVGHAAVALENARLFTRMDQANRHWVEIFDAISDFIVVHDEQHNVLRVNRAMADFIGVRPTELIGLSMSALLAPAGEVSQRHCPFCRRGAPADDEFVQPVLERTYLVSTSQIHASESESLQTIHVLKDITDRREAERRYRELFDNIQEGLFFTSPEGRFIEVNDALVRMLGYDSREQLLQADVPRDIYANPDHRREMIRLMEQHGGLRNHHETLRRKDGSLIHVLINAFAVRDGQGRIVQFRGLMLDITDLTNFQSELQRERDFSSKILNNTQSLILVADTAGLISYANRRWYEAGGYEQPQLVGHRLVELIAHSRRQAVLDALHATLAGQQVDNLEVPVMRADGRTGQFSINLSPMRDDQGHVSSIVVVMSDITDTAMLQAKLVHTEKLAAVGQLVSGVAHEVNNPLTAILGFADLLMDNPELPESARKDLRVILQEAQRTKQIVQNLLSFARQMPPQRRPLQLNQILSQTLQLRAYDFSSHGVEVVQHLHDNLPEVIGDSHQLQQVFLNIINNAYDAVRDTGRPARIEIMTASTQGFAEAAVRDNGDGIQHIERIFDPFFTTKEVGKGTGLGLSICYGIVREHGGEIYCHNNQHGPGATFVVRLPAVSEATIAASAGGPQ